MEVKTNYVNVIDAATTGALDGIRLAVNVGVMYCLFGVVSSCKCSAGMVGVTGWLAPALVGVDIVFDHGSCGVADGRPFS